jgi:hypothetical protein
VIDIAFGRGFGSLTTFNRSIACCFGTTPSDVSIAARRSENAPAG